jgi:hypothetical protein
VSFDHGVSDTSFNRLLRRESLTALPWRERALEEAKRDLHRDRCRCDDENAKNDNVGNEEIRGAT